MKNIVYPQDQVFWNLKATPNAPLRSDITADVVVVGGGMAGLSAAQSFAQKGCSVVLLEKYVCGSGASGKSSGFITPDSELGLPFFVNEFGYDHAKKVWNFATSGSEFIRNNIKQYGISCDYRQEDVLVVANSARAFKGIQEEHAIYQKSHTESVLYNQGELKKMLGSEKFFGGIRLPGTFGISDFDYIQAMKHILHTRGITVYEETPAIGIEGNKVLTAHGSVTAKHIVVCVDHFLPELGGLQDDVYQAQTFIILSEPLPEEAIKLLFPQEKFMLWDTDLVYTYFRLVDNNRLLVGGADVLSTYWGREQHDLTRIYKKLSGYVQEKFPYLHLDFPYMWPGLLGVSKDLIPIAGFDERNPHVYYVSAATGLAWASALGQYSAQRIIDGNKEFDTFFTPYRKYPLSSFWQKIFGKRIVFSLSNFINESLKS